MRVAYFDCFSGASGDMILGALLSAGWPIDELAATIACLNVADYRMDALSITKQGLAATQVTFELPQEPPRPLAVLLTMVEAASLPLAVKSDALRVLRRLGEAEAQVHGIDLAVEDVHLHELGSLDTVFDIVGAVAGLHALGVDEVSASPINLGSGFVNTAHGRLPVPVPAVANLVRGLPVYGGSPGDGELCTPTGAALLSVLGKRFGPLPMMTVEAVGCGAGLKDGSVPNVLRLWLGKIAPSIETDEVTLLECNLDDMNPEWHGPLIERLLAAGALDAYLTPVVMKKGRPGIVLGVLCPPNLAVPLGDLVFEETTTLGIRSSVLSRRRLERDEVVVDTPFGAIRIKVGRRDGRVITSAPEFEDCRQVAVTRDIPLKKVYEAAQRAYWETDTNPSRGD